MKAFYVSSTPAAAQFSPRIYGISSEQILVVLYSILQDFSISQNQVRN